MVIILSTKVLRWLVMPQQLTATPSTVVLVQSLSHVQLFATPQTAARQAPLSFTISGSLLRFMSIETVMLSNHLILCRPGLEARVPARRREERGCGPVTGKDRASCRSGRAPALRPGAVAQTPAERLLWPWRASPSASQLLAFSPLKEQAAGVWET